MHYFQINTNNAINYIHVIRKFFRLARLCFNFFESHFTDVTNWFAMVVADNNNKNQAEVVNVQKEQKTSSQVELDEQQPVNTGREIVNPDEMREVIDEEIDPFLFSIRSYK